MFISRNNTYLDYDERIKTFRIWLIKRENSVYYAHQIPLLKPECHRNIEIKLKFSTMKVKYFYIIWSIIADFEQSTRWDRCVRNKASLQCDENLNLPTSVLLQYISWEVSHQSANTVWLIFMKTMFTNLDALIVFIFV